MRPRPCGICRAAEAVLYPQGWRCPEHAPPAAPTPDPTRTAAALAERRARLLRAMAGAR